MAKPGELKIRWGRDDYDRSSKDVLYEYGGGGADRDDMRILMFAFENTEVFEGKTLRQLLTARGYDLTTIRFSIKQKKAA